MFRYLQGAARVPGLLYAILLPLRLRPLRRLPIAFGLLTKHGIDRDLGDAWLATFLADRAVRRVMAKVLRGIRRRDLVEAAERLKGFDRPVVLAFAPQDRCFSMSHAERWPASCPTPPGRHRDQCRPELWGPRVRSVASSSARATDRGAPTRW